MKKIALVTDSTADLTPEMIKTCNAHVVQLKVKFADGEYPANEITSDEFYARLQKEKALPKTSQPNPEDFISLYSKLLEDYQEIISIHLSSRLSGTLNAAQLAKEKLKANINIVDSKTISLGMGLMVMEAANHIRNGLESSQILDKIKDVRNNIETLFTINTLEYLHKGGRIGKVSSLLGSLLNIKPVVRVGDDGVYHAYGKACSQKKALKLIVKAFRDLANGRKPVKLVVAHGAAKQAGLCLKEALESAFELKASTFTQVGPVIGVHTGPGTVGAAIQYE